MGPPFFGFGFRGREFCELLAVSRNGFGVVAMRFVSTRNRLNDDGIASYRSDHRGIGSSGEVNSRNLATVNHSAQDGLCSIEPTILACMNLLTSPDHPMA